MTNFAFVLATMQNGCFIWPTTWMHELHKNTTSNSHLENHAVVLHSKLKWQTRKKHPMQIYTYCCRIGCVVSMFLCVNTKLHCNKILTATKNAVLIWMCAGFGVIGCRKFHENKSKTKMWSAQREFTCAYGTMLCRTNRISDHMLIYRWFGFSFYR